MRKPDQSSPSAVSALDAVEPIAWQEKAGTREIVRFLAQDISPQTYLNIMAQYHPNYQSFDIPRLSRRPTMREFNEAVDLAQQQGLERLDRHSSPPTRLVPR